MNGERCVVEEKAVFFPCFVFALRYSKQQAAPGSSGKKPCACACIRTYGFLVDVAALQTRRNEACLCTRGGGTYAARVTLLSRVLWRGRGGGLTLHGLHCCPEC